MTSESDRGRERSRALRYVAAWLVAAALAVAVGVFAVSSVGATMRGRGPIGNEQARNIEMREGRASPDPDDVAVRETFEGEYGTFLVECRGPFALGISADTAPGWRTVSYEPGPDDDVDAVFSSGDRSIDLEVYCNLGRPSLAEQEFNTLPSSTPSG